MEKKEKVEGDFHTFCLHKILSFVKVNEFILRSTRGKLVFECNYNGKHTQNTIFSVPNNYENFLRHTRI